MNILLDLDGTLTDSKKGIIACIQHAMVSLGQPAPSEAALLKYVGPPLKLAFRELLPDGSDADIDRAIAAYRERFSTVGMFENEVYPNIPGSLKLLRERGARLFVATSKPRVFAERILDHFELRHYFDAIYGSELDGQLTDKRDLIAHALSRSSLSHSKTIMVGDRHHDAVGAIANGVRIVGVLWGYGSREELTNARVEKFLEVPRDLGQLNLNDSLGTKRL
jgi:phosphoglycolate phosphatase